MHRDSKRLIGEIYKNFRSKDIAATIHETARTMVEVYKETEPDCKRGELSFAVSKNPTIDEVKNLLGKEDLTEGNKFVEHTKNGKSTVLSVTIYKFGWLGFVVANEDKKVIGMKVDLNGFET